MEYAPFYIGQKVICVNPNFTCQKDKTYIITRCFLCHHCNKWYVSFGVKPGVSNYFSCCGHQHFYFDEWMAYADRFRAIKEKPQYMTFSNIQELEKTEVLINN